MANYSKNEGFVIAAKERMDRAQQMYYGTSYLISRCRNRGEVTPDEREQIMKQLLDTHKAMQSAISQQYAAMCGLCNCIANDAMMSKGYFVPDRTVANG